MIDVQLRKRGQFVNKARMAVIYTESAISLMAKRDWKNCQLVLEYALNNLSDCYELIGGLKEKDGE